MSAEPGQRCLAPTNLDSGPTVRSVQLNQMVEPFGSYFPPCPPQHLNAMVDSVDADAGVCRVYFLTPMCLWMVPCPDYLNSKCPHALDSHEARLCPELADEHDVSVCPYSHGAMVPLQELRPFAPPDLR